mmetsp:Transcript_11325/g.26070  ORF Transcript_11325/g.26070 Transcript_11325/m.26070 type:complete len:624 (-) Transcript_11325:79-1950(-)
MQRGEARERRGAASGWLGCWNSPDTNDFALDEPDSDGARSGANATPTAASARSPREQGQSSGLAARLHAIPKPLWMQGVVRSFRFLFSLMIIFVRYVMSQPKVLPSNMVKLLKDPKFLERVMDVNKKAATDSLEVVLQLGGYYIKAAQTMCGARVLPEGFDEVFAVLLDDCPRQPFDVIRDIIEEELGLAITDVFDDFQEEAVAAASIGQVHFARLKDGTPVAVKVQYPQVEKFFKMDVRTVGLLMTMAGMKSQVQQVFATMEKQLEHEFDYTAEAAVMREVANNILPHFGDRVAIPVPIDLEFMQNNSHGPRRTLCTRKVLTMERLAGAPIRRHTLALMRDFAKQLGLSVKEIQELLTTEDPEKVDAVLKNNSAVRTFMNRGPTTECQSMALIGLVKARNFAATLAARLAPNCAACPAPSVAKVAVPLNGPKLSKLLFDVHGHEIFQNGLFNSDPHAGNVLVMEKEKLGLLDYGAVMRLDEDLRTSIARLFVAIATEDDEAVPDAFWECGFRSKRQDRRLALLLAHLSFNRGPFPQDMNRLAPQVGMPKDPDLATLDAYTRGGKLDDITEFPGHLVMLQRCCMVLSGIGIEIGAGRLSAAGMFRAQAELWLQRRGGQQSTVT